MIPSESCVLPAIPSNTTKEIFRQTVFTSALEGSWTGVGHREMVWCHQVRWRVARAALELGGSPSKQAIATILDRWLRDGSHFPSAIRVSQKDLSLADIASYETLPTGTNLVLQKPQGSRTYLFPIPSSISPSKFILYVSQGSIPPVSPQTPDSLRASVYFCNRRTAPESSAQVHLTPPLCTTMSPSVLKLIPSPIPGKPFPIPDEGSDESEGVVLFEVDVHPSDTENKWVAVSIQDASGVGWVIGGFVPSGGAVVSDMGPLGSSISSDLHAPSVHPGFIA
jgi:GPI inositol-deacylase